MSSVDRTREAWLQRCSKLLAKRFKTTGSPLPPVHVSVGFPSRGSLREKGRRIGECWSHEVSGDKRAHIFVSPVLNDPVIVVATFAHELVHAAVGSKAKHGPVFRKCAEAIGLEGKMTATVASAELAAWVTDVCIKKLGAYPHPTFDPRTMTRQKDGTRLLKVECPECGCVARMTRKWLDTSGAPICSCNGETVMVEQ